MLVPGDYTIMQPQMPSQATMGIFQSFMGRRANQRQLERERLALHQAAVQNQMESKSTSIECDGDMTELNAELP